MIQQAWFRKAKWLWMLLPFSLVFYVLSSLRRTLYKRHILRSTLPKLPVIVVGNISVGGNGKTPLSIALVEYLQSQGYRPAVLSRGYGGTQTNFPYLVTANCSASLVGDEPSLIAKRLNCIVVIDPKRVRACEYIANNTQANVIICDDGLQHYAMGRTVELCVLDGRGLGNGFLMPAGPLREGAWRLQQVDALIFNQGFKVGAKAPQALLDANTLNFTMSLRANAWVNLVSGERLALKQTLSPNQLFSNSEICVIAGIGDPQRFFDTVASLGIQYEECISFADHHAYIASDIPNNKLVLMTEKDAVKCAEFAHKNCWYLQIEASLPMAFFDKILKDIDTPK